MIKKRIKNKVLAEALEWLLCIVGAVLVFFFVNYFVFQVAKVDGSSMEPTLHHDDKIIVDRIAHFTGDFARGDIIAFPFPGDPEKNYVKRIVAEPGDVVDLRDDTFYVNGEPLSDDFAAEPIRSLGNEVFPLTVPPDAFFVLGDNRNETHDSRYKEVGCIQTADIIGKTNLRIMPFDRIGFFN